MPLFRNPDDGGDRTLLEQSETGAPALSVVAVENDFVEGVYRRMARFYDLAFGPVLDPGRRRAIRSMGLRPGAAVLEVGVGTGITAALYPSGCAVTGIDLSESMLEKARERVAREKIGNVRLLQMDAAALTFPDATFDIVYAPYMISVVPDPVRVALEMRRVCKPGGRIIFLNHFRSRNPVMARAERLISPFTLHLGFKADLDLEVFLARAGLRPTRIEQVNVPRIWSLVTCVREE